MFSLTEKDGACNVEFTFNVTNLRNDLGKKVANGELTAEQGELNFTSFCYERACEILREEARKVAREVRRSQLAKQADKLAEESAESPAPALLKL